MINNGEIPFTGEPLKDKIFQLSTGELLAQLLKREDLPEEIRTVIGDYLATETPINKVELELTDEELIRQMVKQRKVWYFNGICAKGTELPNGPSKESSFDLGGGATPGYATYYYNANRNQEDNKFMGYVLKPMSDFSEKNHNFFLDYSLMIAIIDSKDPGFSEIIYNGESLSIDNRQTYVPYRISQRIPSNLANKFLERAKKNPNIVEDFFQISFPNLQSDSDRYNGLYRPKITKAHLVDNKSLQAFIEKYPPKKDDSELPYLRDANLIELRKMGQEITFSQPFGSGTAEDFHPIKFPKTK